MSILRQIVRLVAFLLFTLVMAATQAVMLLLPLKDRYAVARAWHRGAAAIIGIRVKTTGALAEGPVLFLANHVSHLDISVLGGVIPGRFVSKQEVASWPLFGLLARLQDTIFIDRSPKASSLRKARIQIQKALSKNERLIIFPEGTNTIGNTVLPFRKGLLEGQSADGYQVQPVAVRCLSVDGQPLETVADYEMYGWGDIGFAPHFWNIMARKVVKVEVVLLPPLSVNADGVIDKIIIEQAEQAVRDTVLNKHHVI